MNTVLMAMSGFGLLCEEVEIVQTENGNDFQVSRNFGVYLEMSSEAKRGTTGEGFVIVELDKY